MPLYETQRAFGESGVPAGETVKVLRRLKITRPGTGVESLGPWKDALEHEVEQVGLDRTSSSTLQGDQGDSRTINAAVFAPWAADIQVGDRITFPSTGVTVQVEGVPDRSRNLFTGWKPPMRCEVQVTHG